MFVREVVANGYFDPRMWVDLDLKRLFSCNGFRFVDEEVILLTGKRAGFILLHVFFGVGAQFQVSPN